MWNCVKFCDLWTYLWTCVNFWTLPVQKDGTWAQAPTAPRRRGSGSEHLTTWMTTFDKNDMSAMSAMSAFCMAFCILNVFWMFFCAQDLGYEPIIKFREGWDDSIVPSVAVRQSDMVWSDFGAVVWSLKCVQKFSVTNRLSFRTLRSSIV